MSRFRLYQIKILFYGNFKYIIFGIKNKTFDL